MDFSLVKHYFLLADDNKNTKKINLVSLSFLLLFVELTLIRWIASNIYYLFFFSNFVLLASFLGIGIGFLQSKNSKKLFKYSPLALAFLIAFSYYFSYQYQIQIDPITNNLIYLASYFKNHLYPVWFSLPFFFIMVAFTMAMLADGVASTFSLFPPLVAYRLEVLGSLLGILFFAILSFFQAPPFAWGAIISLLFTFIFVPQWGLKNKVWTSLHILSIVIIFFTFSKETFQNNHFWSSYYKIEIKHYLQNSYVINVNGLPQQIIESVKQRRKIKPFYFLPYHYRTIKNPLENVLVVGAGTGGDVAIALAEGAAQVDAVEIDSLLYSLGKKLNPDQPYAHKNVRVFVNDGRAFLQQTKKQYDLIIFALTDSLMLIPGQSSIRLENYLYTLEGLTQVFTHLKPHGMFTIYNYYSEQWLVDRIANSLSIIFRHSPCIDTSSPKDYWATVLTISKNPNDLLCKKNWIATEKKYISPVTDDYPFIYLQAKTIPFIYVLTCAFILFTIFLAFKYVGLSFSVVKKNLDLLFMGAAFLLLETKSIVEFALLFGTTWFVNASVFIGILFIVYLAIEITHRYNRFYNLVLYGLFIFSLCLPWIIANESLLALPLLLRFFSAICITFIPILIANIIFAKRFRYAENATKALGVNLIGAVVGGLLEYLALIIGYRHLALVILLLYLSAILVMKTKTEIQ